VIACGKIPPVILAGDGGGLAWPPPAFDPVTAAMPAVTITAPAALSLLLALLNGRGARFSGVHGSVQVRPRRP